MMVVITSPYWQTKAFYLSGIKFNVNFISLDNLVARVLLQQAHNEIERLATGKVYYLRTNNETINYLIKISKKYFSDWPKSIRLKEHIKLIRRDYFTNRIEEIKEKLKKDKSSALYVMNYTFPRIIDSYYELNCLWKLKPGHIMNDLVRRDNTLYQLCRKYMEGAVIGQRFEILRKIIEHVLKPWGGLVKEWKYPPEEF